MSTPQSKMSQARAGAPPSPGKFAQALSGAQVFEPFVVPGLGIPALMTVVGHARVQEIEGAVFSYLQKLSIPLSELTALTYEAERAVRTLALAVRDPDDRSQPLGSLADWQEMTGEHLAEAWRMYMSLRATIDPLSQELSKEDRANILHSIEKKSLRLLVLCGPSRLAAYILSTADQPST